MYHCFALALLLQSSSILASDPANLANEQDSNAQVDSVSLLQTQLQVNHIEHVTSEGRAEVNNSQIAISEAHAEVNTNARPLGHPTTAAIGSAWKIPDYKYGCAHTGKWAVVLKYSTILLIPLLCMIGFVLSVIMEAPRSQPPQAPAGQQLSGATGPAAIQPPVETVRSVGLAPIIFRFMGPVFVLVMVNQTIVMPAAEIKSETAGQSVSFSGYLIGSYALGVCASFPFFLYCAYNSYRLGMFAVGIACVLGNLLYAVAQSPVVIIATRIFCGFEGGIIFMNQAMVQQLTQGDGLLKATAQVIIFPFIGLILGPVTSSICQWFAPSAPPEVPPSLFMVACGSVFSIAVLLWFPNYNECHAQACAAGLKKSRLYETNIAEQAQEAENENENEEIQHQKPEIDAYEYCRSQLSVALLSFVNFNRMVQRLFWETAALHLFAENYELGIKTAGALLTLSLSGLFCLPCIVLPLRQRTGTVGALRIMDAIEVLGIFMMFRGLSFGISPLALFMVGSTWFYVGNMGQFNFLVPLRQELAKSAIWTLSIEGGVFLYSLFQSLGAFFGPVVARELQEICDSQNVIPAFLLSTWIINLVGKEISVHWLLKH